MCTVVRVRVLLVEVDIMGWRDVIQTRAPGL